MHSASARKLTFEEEIASMAPMEYAEFRRSFNQILAAGGVMFHSLMASLFTYSAIEFGQYKATGMAEGSVAVAVVSVAAIGFLVREFRTLGREATAAQLSLPDYPPNVVRLRSGKDAKP